MIIIWLVYEVRLSVPGAEEFSTRGLGCQAPAYHEKTVVMLAANIAADHQDQIPTTLRPRLLIRLATGWPWSGR